MTRRLLTAALMLFVATAAAGAEFVVKERVATPYDIFEIKVAAGEPVLFIPQQPLDLKMLQYHLQDGGFVCVIPTGPPGQVIYLDAWRNGEPGQIPVFVRVKIVVGGPNPNPNPDPEPDPQPPGPLTGVAKEIYDIAVQVGRPADAGRISAAYGGVASKIAAGAIRTLPQARTAIAEAMTSLGPLDSAWKATGDACTRVLNEQGQTIETARGVLEAISRGLRRVADG